MCRNVIKREIKKMERRGIISSNVKSIGYDNKNEILEIEFKQGSCYQYKKVSKKLYQNLMNAKSKGKFLNQNIKPNHSCEKI